MPALLIRPPAEPHNAPPVDFAALTYPVACVDIGGTKVAVSMADHNGMRGRV